MGFLFIFYGEMLMVQLAEDDDRSGSDVHRDGKINLLMLML
jgi:hypothetical protein